MTRHSIVAKTALLLFVCLVSVGAVDWSTLTAEQLSLLPASDFIYINSTDLASIPPAACSGFNWDQISAIGVAAIVGFTDAQLAQLASRSCHGFSAAQMQAFAPTSWKALSPDCIYDLSRSGCTAFSASVLDQLSSDQISSIRAGCVEVIPPTAFNVQNASKVFSAFSSNYYACGGFTPQQMQNFPAVAPNYFDAKCVINFNMDLCAQLNTTFVALLPTNAFAFTYECVAKMAPKTFSLITKEQFTTLESYTSCSAFSPGLVHNLPPYLASNISYPCFINITVEACAAMTYDFARNVWLTGAFKPECITKMNDETLLAFDDPYVIVKLSAPAFGAIDRLYLFSQITLLAVSYQQWVNVGDNLGGILAVDLVEVLTTFDYPVAPIKLPVAWSSGAVSNYWQLDQFMRIVEEDLKFSGIADLTWKQIMKYSWNDPITWIELALLRPLTRLQYIEKFNPLSMPGFRTDQIRDLDPQSFQNFTAAQSYYFRSNIISIFDAAQIAELKPETFANMTQSFKFLNPSVISNLTIAQLRALNEIDFSEFTCDQLQKFKREQIRGLDTAAQNRYADLREKCLASWLDPSKLTLIEIVVIVCGSAIVVIAMVIIAIVKIKQRADRDRAPLLDFVEDT